ncbi:hypothetical protein J8M20_09060 [Pseudoalteromonas luteoviolacea]|uniref:beta-lactamase hydrolase domain-containing protein n=1 Tax=Pseudoalteromonas luteoviolacea TaxID=43657 RepID=UPI001B381761|nr:sulfur transferase domain-containing protein [Pseudoalteromonas luteoviolacea]MBQ4811486.1 hypothetical protein [Pseudoalteromonas luteoviolacea]
MKSNLQNLMGLDLPVGFFQVIHDKLIVGGQPSERDLFMLKSYGISLVVNCIPEYEQTWDEQALVSRLGMEYMCVGFDRASGITIANAEALMATLQSCANRSTFVHCQSGNRIGILVAIYHYFLLGKPEKEAISEGRLWGMRDTAAFMNIVEESRQ